MYLSKGLYAPSQFSVISGDWRSANVFPNLSALNLWYWYLSPSCLIHQVHIHNFVLPAFAAKRFRHKHTHNTPRHTFIYCCIQSILHQL